MHLSLFPPVMVTLFNRPGTSRFIFELLGTIFLSCHRCSYFLNRAGFELGFAVSETDAFVRSPLLARVEFWGTLRGNYAIVGSSQLCFQSGCLDYWGLLGFVADHRADLDIRPFLIRKLQRQGRGVLPQRYLRN